MHEICSKNLSGIYAAERDHESLHSSLRNTSAGFSTGTSTQNGSSASCDGLQGAWDWSAPLPPPLLPPTDMPTETSSESNTPKERKKAPKPVGIRWAAPQTPTTMKKRKKSMETLKFETLRSTLPETQAPVKTSPDSNTLKRQKKTLEFEVRCTTPQTQESMAPRIPVIDPPVDQMPRPPHRNSSLLPRRPLPKGIRFATLATLEDDVHPIPQVVNTSNEEHQPQLNVVEEKTPTFPMTENSTCSTQQLEIPSYEHRQTLERVTKPWRTIN
jgi:hypothetical protein